MEIFHAKKNLNLMGKEDIVELPRAFILNFAAESIDDAWSKLPEEYRRNFEFLKRVKCRIHDHSDKRILPMIKDCKHCNVI